MRVQKIRRETKAKRVGLQDSLPQTIRPTHHDKTHLEPASGIKLSQPEVIEGTSSIRVEPAYGDNQTSYIDGWII